MSRALVLPHIDIGKGRQTITMPSGASIADMVTVAFPALTEARRELVRVSIGEDIVPQSQWQRVRPRESTVVVIRLVPAGSDTLRSVLTVAIIVAAIAVGQYYAPGLAGSVAGAEGATSIGGAALVSTSTVGIYASATTAAFALAGTMLLNAFIPQAGLGDQGKGTSLNSITGLQNSSNPGGVIPSILGRHRYAPVYAAMPYTEVIGDDQYVIAAFLFGHGPLNFYDHQFGDTPIGNFADVQMEVRRGLPGDAPLALYPQQVIEEQLTVNLRNVDPPTSRFTARDATEVSVDITFIQGLVYIDSKGRNALAEVVIRRRQRKVGDVAWTTLPDLAFFGNTRSMIRRTARWTLPERGQYEIDLYRTVADHEGDASQIMDRSDWTAIRSFRPESPFNHEQPLAMVALRIRASNQLNGIVNNYNAVAALVCKDWDAGTGTWIERETSNAASLARYVLQGPANVRRKTDAEIDLAKLKDWHAFNASKGLAYNRVHDYDATRLDVLRDVCAAGRASPHDDGTKWTVVIDRPQDVYVSAITPRNSWDFQGTTPYPLFPDGHRVKFIDATNGWNQAERIVPFPGVRADEVEITEDLDHPGVTDPDQIWKATRRRQYELIHRPHTYTISQDIESLVLARGDLAPLNHDVLDRDHVSARVRAVTRQDITLDDAVTMEAGRSYAASIRRADGTSIRRAVTTVAGDMKRIHLVGDLTGVEEGALLLFGTTMKGPTIDVLVKNVERGDNLTAKLTLVDAAPQIDELVDAEIPPPWDSRVGGEIDVSALIPAVPDIAVTSDGFVFRVSLRPGTNAITPTTSYVVSYRLHGGGSFSMVTVTVGEGIVALSGFVAGDVVDFKAHAVSNYGQPSADTGIIQATMILAIPSTPRADTDGIKADSTLLTADYF
jgi:hypothetical protein